MKKIYTFIEDAGHGWLEVPIKDIKELGIKNKITKCSFIDENNVYLEEDLDAPLFENMYINKFKRKPKYKDILVKELSLIRACEHYNKRNI